MLVFIAIKWNEDSRSFSDSVIFHYNYLYFLIKILIYIMIIIITVYPLFENCEVFVRNLHLSNLRRETKSSRF